MDISHREYEKQSDYWQYGYNDATAGRSFDPTGGSQNKVGINSYIYDEYQRGYLAGED